MQLAFSPAEAGLEGPVGLHVRRGQRGPACAGVHKVPTDGRDGAQGVGLADAGIGLYGGYGGGRTRFLARFLQRA